MRHLPPIRWADVTPGTVVLLEGHTVARTVAFNQNYEDMGWRMIWMEGMGPFTVKPDDPAYPVELDGSDAIGTLHASGLNPAPIEGN